MCIIERIRPRRPETSSYNRPSFLLRRARVQHYTQRRHLPTNARRPPQHTLRSISRPRNPVTAANQRATTTCRPCVLDTALLPPPVPAQRVSANAPHDVPPHAADIIQAVQIGSIDDPPHPPQRVRSHTPLRVSFTTSPPSSPTPSDDPDPSLPWAPDRADSPAPPPTTDYHIFAVYQRDTVFSFIPDSDATYILIRESDVDILSSVAPFPPHTREPHFEVANKQFIVPFASGFIAFPTTGVTLRDLVDNLFGIAPLLRHGYIATFTENDFALHTSSNILLYGTKAPLSNTWSFSLPRPSDYRAVLRSRPPSRHLPTTSSLKSTCQNIL
jgi:hypothetical protein